MTTVKIGTHNSATGEPGKGLLSWLITPFAKCQSKTIKEQIESGCTYFDLRVKYVDNQLVMAHGLWTSKTTLEDVLEIINHVNTLIYYSITYEGKLSDKERFLSDINSIIRRTERYIPLTPKTPILTYIAVKKPTWEVIKQGESIPAKQGFIPLDWSSWHTIIPIPWLWNKLYSTPHIFNNTTYKLVDFL